MTKKEINQIIEGLSFSKDKGAEYETFLILYKNYPNESFWKTYKMGARVSSLKVLLSGAFKQNLDKAYAPFVPIVESKPVIVMKSEPPKSRKWNSVFEFLEYD